MISLPHYEVLIKESHLDSFGHVNNATYLTLFEEARWQIVTDRGYGYKEVHEHKKGPVILEVQLKFLKEIKLREFIKIDVEVLSYEGLVGSMKQKMYKPSGDVAAEAIFKFGFFDLVSRKLIKPSSEWSVAIGLN